MDLVKQQESSTHLETNSERGQTRNEYLISEVVEMVYEWQQIHEGKSEKNQYVAVDFQIAAKILGMKKRNLKDFMKQLQFGYIYNFDFNAHQNQKISVLRYFNNLFLRLYNRVIQDTINEAELLKALKMISKKEWKKLLKEHKQDNGEYCCDIQHLKEFMDDLELSR